jgi:hypothetical protein
MTIASKSVLTLASVEESDQDWFQNRFAMCGDSGGLTTEAAEIAETTFILCDLCSLCGDFLRHLRPFRYFIDGPLWRNLASRRSNVAGRATIGTRIIDHRQGDVNISGRLFKVRGTRGHRATV